MSLLIGIFNITKFKIYLDSKQESHFYSLSNGTVF
jgi:hypothetical protein